MIAPETPNYWFEKPDHRITILGGPWDLDLADEQWAKGLIESDGTLTVQTIKLYGEVEMLFQRYHAARRNNEPIYLCYQSNPSRALILAARPMETPEGPLFQIWVAVPRDESA